MTHELPTVALSIRQPWAWLIAHGFKDIENRSRNIGNHLGPILIHASAHLTADELADAVAFLKQRQLTNVLKFMPHRVDEFERGGIVGMATINGHGNFEMKSPWWIGPYSYTLIDAAPLPFQPCNGRLGFFPCAYSVLSVVKTTA